MRIRYHVLRDIHTPVDVPLNTLGWREFTAHADWKQNLVSTTSLLWHPPRQRLVCGLTHFGSDLMYEFDPQSERFRCLDYARVSEPFEIKIHRSLALADDRGVYGATACLHREDQRYEAPGGRLFYCDLQSGSYDFLGIPLPHDYIQTITFDRERGLLYGITYPIFTFFVFDIAARRTRRSYYVGSAPHVMAVDDSGCIWSTWSPRTHNLFKYDPDADRMQFFDHGLSAGGAGLMYPGAGPIDMMLNGGDGFLYVGLTTGELVRIDPASARVEYLGKPSAETRLPALEIGPDGRLWGICGFLGRCRLFAYDRQSRAFEDFGLLADERTSEPIFIAHDMAFVAPDRLFVGETDTTQRAGYLWDVQL